ncbi:DNA-binding response regulator [Chitinimonas prasina]|uniref:DNA-binding response regulator n=1 Tax=Chitinimonas prasina TaxID=1434937 RepID=A0ABQ5YFW8_9NEIS|nr:LytTR family DNA-binding domain-containing protein [Chitinimonas prasina]GLR13481.1 DNA-binding response regulator [Chitinimonas prasina]
MLRCVIAEDEPLLRQALQVLLSETWPSAQIVALCEEGGEALEAISALQPEVALLDIRMPGLTGLEVAAAAAEVSPATQVVFITAYDQYAIDAFERGAVDYLLKPVSRERLASTMHRLQTRAAAGAIDHATLVQLLGQLNQRKPATPEPAPLVWLTASAGKETRLILVEDVVYFQSDNKYTVVMTAEGEALLRKPLKELLPLLDTNLFKQIHRATIVNLKAIASISRDDSGKGAIKLKQRPELLSISQPFMALFKTM